MQGRNPMTDSAQQGQLERPAADRLYAPEQDMWVQLDADNVATIGATHVVVSHGQFMMFTPRPTGTTVDRDRSLGVMETAKTAVAVHAPLSCEIIEVNAAVLADVALIERDPYGEGWLFRVRPTALERERDSLLDAEAYARWLAPRLASRRQAPIDPSADLDFDPMRGY
jgi:glycine cleavage system H protein